MHPKPAALGLAASAALLGSLMSLAGAGPVATASGFSGSLVTTSTIRAATFSPSVAPLVTSVRRQATNQLSWAAVSVPSGAAVLYVVIRIPANGSPVQVCTGADTPTSSGGVVTCVDRFPSSNGADLYTEQPYLVVGGVRTWSLPASAPN